MGRVDDFDGFYIFILFSPKSSPKSSSPGWSVGLGSLRSCGPAGMTKPLFRWTLGMELELQEAPERFYFTKKRLFSRKKKPQQASLVQSCVSWAGVGRGGLGWNRLLHPSDWVFPQQ